MPRWGTRAGIHKLLIRYFYVTSMLLLTTLTLNGVNIIHVFGSLVYRLYGMTAYILE